MGARRRVGEERREAEGGLVAATEVGEGGNLEEAEISAELALRAGEGVEDPPHVGLDEAAECAVVRRLGRRRRAARVDARPLDPDPPNRRVGTRHGPA